MEKTRFITPNECDLGENWEDYYLEVSNIKKGETIYECYGGKNIQYQAISDARRVKDGWYCKTKNTKNEIVELYMSANTSYTGISFFRTPQHLEYDEEKGYIYPIV